MRSVLDYTVAVLARGDRLIHDVVQRPQTVQSDLFVAIFQLADDVLDFASSLRAVSRARLANVPTCTLHRYIIGTALALDTRRLDGLNLHVEV